MSSSRRSNRSSSDSSTSSLPRLEKRKAEQKESVKKKEREKKKKKRSRRQKREENKNENSCYVCMEDVNAKERFFPCNCDFAPVHRHCLRDWIANGKSKCRICQHNYDVERQNSLCFVCQTECADGNRFLPCRCRHIVVHSACLLQRYEAGQHSCVYCQTDYVVRYKKTLSCSTKRCSFFWDGILFVFSLLLTVFFIAPFDILTSTSTTLASSHVLKHEFTLYNETLFSMMPLLNKHTGPSFLLFPGAAVEDVVDILYIVTTGLVLMILLILGCMMVIFGWNKVYHAARWKKRIVAVCTIFTVLAFHLFGNVHYRFYCGIGVIPPENCFYLFDWRSFYMWFSGLFIVGLPLSALIGLVFLFKWLFVTKKRQIVSSPSMSRNVIQD